MALVGNISEYKFGLGIFLEANFQDPDTLELRTVPVSDRADIVKNQSIDVAAKSYLLGSGAHQVKSETIKIGDNIHILTIAWIEPDGYLGTFYEFCYDC
jgi:hypothetical protein